MATAAQLTANRANAVHSTGPVSLEGKARVAQNATKHGLTSRHLVIRPDEHEEFAALRDALAAELVPQGAVESLTFNEVLHAAWNLQPSTASPAYQARAQRAYYRALQELPN